MVEKGWGRIRDLSVTARRGKPATAPPPGGMHAHDGALAQEWPKRSVNTVSPTIGTDMVRAIKQCWKIVARSRSSAWARPRRSARSSPGSGEDARPSPGPISAAMADAHGFLSGFNPGCNLRANVGSPEPRRTSCRRTRLIFHAADEQMMMPPSHGPTARNPRPVNSTKVPKQPAFFARELEMMNTMYSMNAPTPGRPELRDLVLVEPNIVRPRQAWWVGLQLPVAVRMPTGIGQPRHRDDRQQQRAHAQRDAHQQCTPQRHRTGFSMTTRQLVNTAGNTPMRRPAAAGWPPRWTHRPAPPARPG